MYIVYKTTNNINGKIYIGYQFTQKKYNGYLGSGKLLKRAINKYGKESFTKKILKIVNSKKEALDIEANLVNKDFVERRDTYNLKKGGEGGWDYINMLFKTDIEFKKRQIESIRDGTKRAYREGKAMGWAHYPYTMGFYKKHHSDQTKEMMSKNSYIKLKKDVVEQRIKDYKNIEKKWGHITKLAKKWNTSRSGVKGFLLKYYPNQDII